MTKQTQWVFRWKTWIAARRSKPGVFRRKEGGFLVRGRAIDPRTGRRREVQKVVACADARDAFQILQEELRRIREGTPSAQRSTTRFAEFAASLFEEKVTTGEIRSAAGRDKWATILERHLIPTFGDLLLDQLRHDDGRKYHRDLAERIARDELSPATANTRLNVLRVIVKRAVIDLDLPKNPMDGIKNFDTSEHPTYTEEEPNSLTIEEAKRFLAKLRQKFPQHFAFTAVMLSLGQRPSTLRPLRRTGPTPDFLPKEGLLLIRRSQTKGDPMETTKTKIRQRIPLPKELVDLLSWHVAELPAGPMRDSDLLFPSDTGGYRSRSCLDRPFREVATAIKLKKTITPKAMRRTFQDLARAGEVKDIVTRAISGHATETMQHHYSTVDAREVEAGLAKVISLAGVRDALRGGKRGGKEPRTKKASAGEA